MPATRVAVVDDHQLVRIGLKQIIESQPDFTWAGEAKTGREALTLLRGTPCDVLERISALESRLYQVRYEKALRDHPGPCDCAALVAVDHRDRRPSSLRLIETVVERYAYEWQCTACGMRWSEDRDCDDVAIRSRWYCADPAR